MYHTNDAVVQARSLKYMRFTVNFPIPPDNLN